jgi:chitin disaccharide deacetylase
MSAPVPFILCADDYGLAPGVGAAIRELIAQGRLSATSCMTAGPYWPEEARLLAPLADRADIGLHFTLTDQTPAGPMPMLAPDGRLPPIGRLMKDAYTGRLDPAEIAAEFARQLHNFAAALGRTPDFIDGHQHVHLLPVVRDVVAAAARELPGVYLRSCVEPAFSVLKRGVAAPKALLLSAMGRAADTDSRPRNRGFRGAYDLTDRVPFGALMARFLRPPRPGMLVMVHPGFADDALRAVDRVVAQREAEHAYLAGADFGDLLTEVGATPARFKDCF